MPLEFSWVLPMSQKPSPLAPLAALTDLLSRLRRHLSIAHQVPGRVRLRVGLGALAEVQARPIESGVSDLKRYRGVTETRVNLAARSAVISYDPKVIPDTFWPRCLSVPEAELPALLADVLALKDA